jgi:adenylosuccinate synthase
MSTNNTTTLDVIVDLQYGDCGKGKISHHLIGAKESKTSSAIIKPSYTHVIRYNGGGNAGHTIFHKGKKFITHQLPAGVFYGVPSIIGPGCVVHVQSFLEEIEMLEAGGVKTKNKIFIAKNAHIVTDDILAGEKSEKAIGTTKQGIGPTYAAKAARTGIRAESVPELAPYIIDMYEVPYGDKAKQRSQKNPSVVLAEGAQGFGLDIDWGDYPYVTSSHCTVAGALTNGFTHRDVRHVWGVAKVYETYVGSKTFEPTDSADTHLFQKLRELGGEYGATTGRPRQCNWLSMPLLRQAVQMNGVSHIVFNKMDILESLGTFAVYEAGPKKQSLKKISFKTHKQFEAYITTELQKLGLVKKNIFFSRSPERI